MKITIPVGAGELVDKITILTIKSERISDETKLINVRHELSLLTLVQAEALGYWSEVPTLRDDLKRINEAQGDAAAFTSVLTEYVKAPEVTRKRLYLETMTRVIPGLSGTWIVDDSVTQLLPMVQGKGLGGGK